MPTAAELATVSVPLPSSVRVPTVCVEPIAAAKVVAPVALTERSPTPSTLLLKATAPALVTRFAPVRVSGPLTETPPVPPLIVEPANAAVAPVSVVLPAPVDSTVNPPRLNAPVVVKAVPPAPPVMLPTTCNAPVSAIWIAEPATGPTDTSELVALEVLKVVVALPRRLLVVIAPAVWATDAPCKFTNRPAPTSVATFAWRSSAPAAVNDTSSLVEASAPVTVSPPPPWTVTVSVPGVVVAPSVRPPAVSVIEKSLVVPAPKLGLRALPAPKSCAVTA